MTYLPDKTEDYITNDYLNRGDPKFIECYKCKTTVLFEESHPVLEGMPEALCEECYNQKG